MSKDVRWLNKIEADYLGLKIKENEPKRSNARYSINKEQWQSIKTFREIKQTEFKEVKRTLDKKGNVIGRVEKLTSKDLINIPDNHKIKRVSTNVSTGQQWVITEPNKDTPLQEIDFDSIIKKHIKAVTPKARKIPIDINDFDVLTYTDVHIGMDTDKFNKSMYATKWDKESVLDSANKIIKETYNNQSSHTLVIDELGDLLDGYNGFTTRGGHSLPQNMTNEQAFDLALSFKIKLIDELQCYYPNIIVNNICNDNHAGSFGYFVNSAFKQVINQKYPHLEVNNHNKFINHYFMGKVCFIITHGKDDSTLKFGFKPFLDAKGVEKIDQYCKHNDIYKKSDLVIFKIGDSHQALFDMCTSDDFYYYNYPALSPSSQWVQNNFKKGRRGFVIETFNELQNTIKPYFIK
jgi:hypothetical protein